MPAELYLDLLKQVLTRSIAPERYCRAAGPWAPSGKMARKVLPALQRVLATRNLEIVRQLQVGPTDREQGCYWPPEAHTMLGTRRLDNLHSCIRAVIHDGIAGDFIEAGVWRGGAAIFMRAALAAYEDSSRAVWVADSFEGLPEPDPVRYPADSGDSLWREEYLAVSLEEVKANFEKFGLLDARVRFLKGWFKDTLAQAPINQLAVVRLDGDMYESTIQSLAALYPRLAVGGYLIVDDYNNIPACRKAVEDFRTTNRITEPIEEIDWTAIYWRRQGAGEIALAS